MWRRLRRCIGVLGLTIWLVGTTVSAAHASQSARISAAFIPEKLGAPTTVSLGFQVASSGGGIPSALTAIDFRYPSDLGLATSGLGMASCAPATLEAHGPGTCPPNSLVGSGSALAKFQIGPEIFQEAASIGIVAGPSPDGYLRLLISATGVTPVAARIVMSTVLSAGRLRINVPLVPSLPEGPAIAVVAVHATLGGGLIYHERRHGKVVAYRPRGVELPRSCPRGGFRFAATFTFLDGSRALARTTVGCPARRTEH
jgi:hypothetical protein